MNVESRIAPAEIVKIGHPALRLGARTVPQELFGTSALYELIEVMRATLAGQGVGLAAPQIAVPLRLFVIEDAEDRMSHLSAEQRRDRHRYPYPFEAVINPTWHAISPRTVIEQEGCLSIPGLTAAFPATGRSKSKDVVLTVNGNAGRSKGGPPAFSNMKSIILTAA
jgi:peptide deformylase